MSGFINILGLAALAALVPFILIYLIKPRARERVMPSLMFFVKDMKIAKQNAFLKHLLRNLLFFMQLFTIAALALTVASPFITVPYAATSQNTVVVLDTSASMQVKDGLCSIEGVLIKINTDSGKAEGIERIRKASMLKE